MYNTLVCACASVVECYDISLVFVLDLYIFWFDLIPLREGGGDYSGGWGL